MTGMDPMRGRPCTVVITGAGLVTSLGIGKADNWQALVNGRSGVRRIRRFSTAGLKVGIAASVDAVTAERPTATNLCHTFATHAIEEALAEAAIGPRGRFPGPLYLAVPPLELDWSQWIRLAQATGRGEKLEYDDLLRAAAAGAFSDLDEQCEHGAVATRLQAAYGTRGAPVSLNTACASGATAIQLGVEAIRRGDTDAALCVGTDSSVNPETLIRFSLLTALSMRDDVPETVSRPFARSRDGFVMGEGAAALVLESLDSARARGAPILGIVSGVGETVDRFHRTRPSPGGGPVAACIGNALRDAGLAPDAIGYINAHGTGTPENDRTEYLGIAAVMGGRDIAVSSSKSMIGHTLSAAGAIEAVITLLALRTQRLPPTINYRDPDPEIPLDVVPNVARDARVAHALSNAFGFGGQNVSLVLSHPDA